MSKQEQAMRLYKAVERLALQAGEDTDEAIDWLCGEHGGMFKLYEAYFSPKPPQRKPLTDEQIELIRVSQEFDQWAISEAAFKYAARAIEAAHGITGEPK